MKNAYKKTWKSKWSNNSLWSYGETVAFKLKTWSLFFSNHENGKFFFLIFAVLGMAVAMPQTYSVGFGYRTVQSSIPIQHLVPSKDRPSGLEWIGNYSPGQISNFFSNVFGLDLETSRTKCIGMCIKHECTYQGELSRVGKYGSFLRALYSSLFFNYLNFSE